MPAPGSQLTAVLAAFKAGVEGLGFVLSGPGPVPVVVKKAAKREEGVDAAEQVTVSGAVQLDEMKPYAFGGVYEVAYRIEVTLVGGSKRDYVRHLDEFAAFREAVRRLFRGPRLAGVASVRDIDYLGGPFLDRAQIAEGYDFEQVAFRVKAVERDT